MDRVHTGFLSDNIEFEVFSGYCIVILVGKLDVADFPFQSVVGIDLPTEIVAVCGVSAETFTGI